MSIKRKPQEDLEANTSQQGPRKTRPQWACAPCRRRKVKCDLLSPCRACTVRGEVKQCKYVLAESGRHALSSHSEIDRLKRELKDLKNGPASSSSEICQNGVEDKLDEPMPKNPMLQAQTRSAIVERFIAHFDARPSRHSWSGWIKNIALYAENGSEVLADAVEATAISYYGVVDKNQDLLNEGRKTYVNTLSRLQKDLNDPDKVSTPDLLYATTILSLYELIVFNDYLPWFTHIYGVGRVIQYRGPESHTHGLEHQTFKIFRMLSLTLHLLLRKPTFLAQPEWKTVPWSRSYPSKNIFDLLVDHLVDIPTLFALDEQLQQPNSKSNQDDLSYRIARFQASLEKWKEDWICTYPGVALQDRLHEAKSPPNLHALCEPILSKDVLLAQSLNLYYAANLLLLRVRSRPSSTPSFVPHDLVRLIIRTSETQLCNENNYFAALLMMFPLRVAYLTPLEDVSYKEMTWRLFMRLDEEFQFEFSKTILSDLPTFGGSVGLSEPPWSSFEVRPGPDSPIA